jgi:hypothetical protein
MCQYSEMYPRSEENVEPQFVIYVFVPLITFPSKKNLFSQEENVELQLGD